SVRVDGTAIDVPLTEARAERALLGVRPEQVRLLAPEAGLRAQVRHAEYFGSHWIVELHTAVGALKALVDKAAKPTEGEHVGLAFDTQRIVLFDATSEQLLASATTSTHQPCMHHVQHLPQ
ncbi:MAG TPA: TOBE domain-containing protein, partial [Methylibium sp.]